MAARRTKSNPRLDGRGPALSGKSRASRAKKISVTIDARVLREVANDARRSGRTLSAQITDALARDHRQRLLKALIEKYEAEHGVISEEELESARKEWQGSRSTVAR